MNIPWAKPSFTEKEQEYLQKALASSWISGGAYVDLFEKKFAELNQAKYCVSTSNGTTALHLALIAAGVGPGDEVIVPAFTFVAPGNMVIAVGAKPVFVDIDPKTWCMDPAAVSSAITSKTKAILPVHIYGNVAAADDIRGICDQHDLILIEDTAEAALSRRMGKCAGTFGHMGTFSFHATKTITMGEGGAVLTYSDELHEKMRIIRDHGMNKSKRYWHEVVGYNFRLTNLQAAVGCAQLERVETMCAMRRSRYEKYRAGLNRLKGVQLQEFQRNVDPVVWALGIQLDPKHFKGNRDWVIESLGKAGIETRPGFYPFHMMPIYQAPKAPISDEIAARMLCLPFYQDLKDEDIDRVCAELAKLQA